MFLCISWTIGQFHHGAGLPQLNISIWLLSLFRWRTNRPGVLTNDQYQAAKSLAIEYIPQFFPNNCLKPVFVPLNPNVAARQNEMMQELQEKFAHDAEAEGEDAARSAPKRYRAQAPVPPPPPVPVHPVLPAHAADVGFDLDAGLDLKAEAGNGEKEHVIKWELDHWFNPVDGALPWTDESSQPSVKWKVDEKVFPRLAFLARRFLCILPTSAPSERIWSGYGQDITKQSASIDSTAAAQKMFLKRNHAIVELVSHQAHA
jgi:hypothetical protein